MRLLRNTFAKLVQEAMARVPSGFASYMDEVVVDVQPKPDRDLLRHLGIADSRSLLGVFQGTPITERSVEHGGVVGNRITIFQRNIERVCRTREEIVNQIRTTVLHEVGHHAIGFKTHSPRCLEEYYAWRWALKTMRAQGFNVTAAVERRMHDAVRYAVAKARRRGLKRLPAELEAYLK